MQKESCPRGGSLFALEQLSCAVQSRGKIRLVKGVKAGGLLVGKENF